MSSKDYIHKEFPKTCDPDDFFAQVKRTVNGKPVPREQIEMMINIIRDRLGLDKNDILLDLCCGNGALTRIFHPEIKSYLGVDFSEYMIEIAKKNFEKQPAVEYRLSDAAEYTKSEPHPERFNKALCYGAFQYLPTEAAEASLKNLSARFKNIEVLFIGNLPDKERADKFYYGDIDYKSLLDDYTSPLGIWRSKNEMKALAERTGWNIEFVDMPNDFYVSHYRYDAKLTRK